MEIHKACLYIIIFASLQVSLESQADDKKSMPVNQIGDELSEQDMPIRVDCSDLPVPADGFGGIPLSCAEQLSLYALFNCFPMKKEAAEESCPDWEGASADIDWDHVADLIDARNADKAAEVEQKNREMERRAREQQERLQSDH